MNLVDCKCPNCNAAIKVDPGKEAAVCEYCGDAFVVERAINNSGTIVNGNVVTNHNYVKDTVFSALKKRQESKIRAAEAEIEKEKRRKIEAEAEARKPAWMKFLEQVGEVIATILFMIFVAICLYISYKLVLNR